MCSSDLDPSINIGTGADSFVETVLVKGDGKIVLGGSFTNFNGQSAPRLTRINGGINLGEGVIGFAAGTTAVAEDAGSLTVSVVRSAGTSNSVSVAFSAYDITATNGQHYTINPGTLTFATGETLKSFSVQIMDDGNVTNVNRTFGLRLYNITSLNSTAVLSTSTNVVTILDNDAIFNFSVPIYVVTEIGRAHV